MISLSLFARMYSTASWVVLDEFVQFRVSLSLYVKSNKLEFPKLQTNNQKEPKQVPGTW